MIGGEADLRRAEQLASERSSGYGGESWRGSDEGGARNGGEYPATLDIDYPETSNRLAVLFRIILIIPIAIVISMLASGILWVDEAGSATFIGVTLFLPILLMILFRRKYPKWWFDWNLALSRFETRVSAYFLLLRDDYPSTDEEQGVHLNLVYPDADRDLNQFLPLVKWILAIPHYIVLIILWVVALIITVVAWFLILILGRYPQGMWTFVVGVERWSLRVAAYMWLLTTDRYPPFSLD